MKTFQLAWTLIGASVMLAQAQQPEVAELKGILDRYESEVEVKADAPYRNALTLLNQKYSAALNRALTAAQNGNKLEDAVALKGDIDRLKAGEAIPEGAPSDPPALTSLRSSYHISQAKLAQDREKAIAPIRTALVSALNTLMGNLTKSGRLDEALVVRDRRDQVEKEIPKVLPLGQPASLRNAKEFTNTLGMRFVDLPGTEVLMCIHETRNQDWAAFAAKNRKTSDSWKTGVFRGVPVSDQLDHPVAYVSWDEAMAFCAWLSEKEGRTYRLPSDREWSIAAGLADLEDPNATIQTLNRKLRDHFPWGAGFPPPANAGNFGDTENMKLFPQSTYTIAGYTDGYGSTSPVMTYPPNALGFYDLGGNVSEWCLESEVINGAKCNVNRGGSYQSALMIDLLTSFRAFYQTHQQHAQWGFRVVLEK